MNLDQQIQTMVIENLTKAWGGRMPTWEEYKLAQKAGQVSVNKSIASKAIFARDMPAPWRVIYGYVVPWASFLVVPTAIALHFFAGWSGWWIAGSIFAAWFLFKVTVQGHCDGVLDGAAQSEHLYTSLVAVGAFQFSPPES